jgi:hypothetical protein
MKDKNKYPKGWNLARVQAVLKYHENQTEEEKAAEIEAMYAARKEIVMTVPTQLVPKFKKEIAAHRAKVRSIKNTKPGMWRHSSNVTASMHPASPNPSKSKKKTKDS